MDIRFNNDRNLTYSVSYTPKYEGKYKVTVLFAGKQIPKSPFTVNVEGFAGDAGKVTAYVFQRFYIFLYYHIIFVICKYTVGTTQVLTIKNTNDMCINLKKMF